MSDVPRWAKVCKKLEWTSCLVFITEGQSSIHNHGVERQVFNNENTTNTVVGLLQVLKYYNLGLYYHTYGLYWGFQDKLKFGISYLTLWVFDNTFICFL